MTVSKFLFGNGLENEIRVGFPLMDLITDREDGEGSEYIDVPDGSVDTWRQNKMFTMQAEARWIPDGPGTNPVQTQLSGPVSWEEFIDWARDGRALRFVPDENVPDFYVDNTYLVEPRKGFGSLSPDIKRNIPLKLRNPAKSFHEAMRGIMFEYAPGASLTDPLAAAFTRAGTAWQLGLNGLYAAAATDVLRDRDYEAGLRGARFDRGATNLIENGDFESDAVGSAASGSATLIRSTAFARNGAASLKVTTANSSSSGAFIHNRAGTRIPATVGLDYVLSGWVYVPAASVGKTVKVRIEWWSSAPAFLSASEVSGIVLVAGWQRLLVTGLAPASTATADCFIGGDSAQGIWDFYIDVALFETGKRPSSAIPTNTAAVTRNNDGALSWSFLWTPQAMFMLVDYTDFGIGSGGGGGASLLAQIGTTFQGGWFLLDAGGGGGNGLQAYHEPLGQAKSSLIGPTAAYKDRVRAVALLFPDGSVQAVRSINGAADAFGGRSTATVDPVFTPWTPATVFIGAAGGFNGFAVHRMKLGPLTFGGTTRDTTAKALAA
jgi:hypothetical protein